MSTIATPMPAITEPGVYEGIPDEIYHADPWKGGSMTSTMARKILSTPADLRHYLDAPRTERPEWDVGHAVHSAALGVGMAVEVLAFDSWRTKDAQNARAEAHLAGRVPMLARDYAEVQAMVDAIRGHPVAGPLFASDGRPELSIFATDPDTEIVMRARPDWTIEREGSRTILVDLKTSRSTSPASFVREVQAHRYDVQQEWYRHTHALANGASDLPAFVFVVVSKMPPYHVFVAELGENDFGDDFTVTGRTSMERALRLYAECTTSGQWPGHSPIVHQLGPTGWFARDIEGTDDDNS